MYINLRTTKIRIQRDKQVVLGRCVCRASIVKAAGWSWGQKVWRLWQKPKNSLVLKGAYKLKNEVFWTWLAEESPQTTERPGWLHLNKVLKHKPRCGWRQGGYEEGLSVTRPSLGRTRTQLNRLDLCGDSRVVHISDRTQEASQQQGTRGRQDPHWELKPRLGQHLQWHVEVWGHTMSAESDEDSVLVIEHVNQLFLLKGFLWAFSLHVFFWTLWPSLQAIQFLYKPEWELCLLYCRHSRACFLQGCPSSLILFVIFMDWISSCSHGEESVQFESRRIVSLLASSVHDLQQALGLERLDCPSGFGTSCCLKRTSLPYWPEYKTTPLFKTNLQKKILITKICFSITNSHTLLSISWKRPLRGPR